MKHNTDLASLLAYCNALIAASEAVVLNKKGDRRG